MTGRVLRFPPRLRLADAPASGSADPSPSLLRGPERSEIEPVAEDRLALALIDALIAAEQAIEATLREKRIGSALLAFSDILAMAKAGDGDWRRVVLDSAQHALGRIEAAMRKTERAVGACRSEPENDLAGRDRPTFDNPDDPA